MISTEIIPLAQPSDVELVSQCLAGNREAFGLIVARYQTLICSLAYSATGSLSQSQDLSQEAFVIAWKQLPELREPVKLRSWLCGILKNRIYKNHRQQGREPIYEAESLEAAYELPAPEPLPSEQTVTKEEEAILWRSLERIPELYREPLILFYREHQSVEAVATSLELSEDAVKQRLSRGRKLLHEQVLALVEGTLEKTSPGKTFTFGVLAALPMTATTTKAATVGTAFATGGAAAKSAATFGSLGSLFAMLGGSYISMRAQADDTKSPRERQFMHQMIGVRIVAVLLTLGAFYGIGKLDLFQERFARDIFNAVFIFFGLVVGTGFFAYASQHQRQIQIEDGTFVEAEWNSPRKEADSAADKSNDFLKAAKFMAFGLILFAMLAANAPWKQYLGQAILLLAGLMATLFGSYRSWQNRPRYHSLRPGWILFFPTTIGLMTMFVFNFHQYDAQSGPTNVYSAPPLVVMVFNFSVVLAYTAFVGVLAWKRKNVLGLKQ